MTNFRSPATTQDIQMNRQFFCMSSSLGIGSLPSAALCWISCQLAIHGAPVPAPQL